MGCKSSKETYPEHKDEILAACTNGNVKYLQALVENKRLVRDLGLSKFQRDPASAEKRARCDGFLTYRRQRVDEVKRGDKPDMIAETCLDSILWFDEAIAAAALADQKSVVAYLLCLDKRFDFRGTAERLMAGGESPVDTVKYLIQALQAPASIPSDFACLLGWAVVENRSDVLTATLEAEPEREVPDGGLGLLAAAKTLPVLQALLADPRIDVVARERKIIADIAGEGTYEMLRTIVADPRVTFGPELASAAFTASVQGANDSVKKLRFIDRRLPEDCRNWEYYSLRWGDACKVCDVETARWFLAKFRECMRSNKKHTEKRFRKAVMWGAIAATIHDNAPVLEELLGMTAGGKFLYRGAPIGDHLLQKCCGLPDPSPSALKILLNSRQIDPAANDSDAFVAACGAGNVDAVRQLLADPRVDPRAQNSRGAKVASRQGHREVVRLILADPRANPGPVPEYVSGKGKEEVAPPPSYIDSDDSFYSSYYYSE